MTEWKSETRPAALDRDLFWQHIFDKALTAQLEGENYTFPTVKDAAEDAANAADLACERCFGKKKL